MMIQVTQSIKARFIENCKRLSAHLKLPLNQDSNALAGWDTLRQEMKLRGVEFIKTDGEKASFAELEFVREILKQGGNASANRQTCEGKKQAEKQVLDYSEYCED